LFTEFSLIFSWKTVEETSEERERRFEEETELKRSLEEEGFLERRFDS
jgi:hypothetical protein